MKLESRSLTGHGAFIARITKTVAVPVVAPVVTMARATGWAAVIRAKEEQRIARVQAYRAAQASRKTRKPTELPPSTPRPTPRAPKDNLTQEERARVEWVKARKNARAAAAAVVESSRTDATTPAHPAEQDRMRRTGDGTNGKDRSPAVGRLPLGFRP